MYLLFNCYYSCLSQNAFYQYLMGLGQRCPWIGFIHGLDCIGLDRIGSNSGECLLGLDWIGSDDCYVQNFDCVCFSAKQPKTVLCSLIISDFLHT